MSHFRKRACEVCGHVFADDCNDAFCSDACEERDANAREARETAAAGMLRGCDRCGAQGPLTYSPAHDASFCEPCLDLEARARAAPRAAPIDRETVETSCPARADEIHCRHWHDGEACCSCGAPEMSDSLKRAQGMIP